MMPFWFWLTQIKNGTKSQVRRTLMVSTLMPTSPLQITCKPTTTSLDHSWMRKMQNSIWSKMPRIRGKISCNKLKEVLSRMIHHWLRTTTSSRSLSTRRPSNITILCGNQLDRWRRDWNLSRSQSTRTSSNQTRISRSSSLVGRLFLSTALTGRWRILLAKVWSVTLLLKAGFFRINLWSIQRFHRQATSSNTKLMSNKMTRWSDWI